MPHPPRAAISLVVAATSLVAGAPAFAAERFAAPNGSGSACTSAAPCNFPEAVQAADAGDEVIVMPGDHGTPAAPFAELRVQQAITVRGVAGQPRPRVFTTGDGGVAFIEGATLRHLEFVHAGGFTAVRLVGGSAEAVLVRSSAANTSACLFEKGVTLRNTVCRASGAGAHALVLEASVGSTATMRNVTARATGDGGFGLRASGFSGAKLAVNVVNTIVRGATGDVYANSNATVNLRTSNYATIDNSGGGSITGPGAAGNQTAPPQLADEAAGDFHQLATSPTVDAGTDEPDNGATDIDGEARKQGARTDIGADERPVTMPGDNGGGGSGGGGSGGGGDQPQQPAPVNPRPAPRFAGISLSSIARLSFDRRGRAVLRLTCPAGAAGRCTGTARLAGRGRLVASASFRIPAGRTAGVGLRLTRRGRANARRLKGRATLTVRATDASNVTTTTTRSVGIGLRRR